MSERLITQQQKTIIKIDRLIQLFTDGRKGDYDVSIDFTSDVSRTSICRDLPNPVEPENKYNIEEELANRLFLDLSSSAEEC